MTIKSLAPKGLPNRAIARQPDLAEGTALPTPLTQRRTELPGKPAAPGRPGCRPNPRRNLAALHVWLIAEHGYEDSLHLLQRYVAQPYPPPARRARRRVEIPPRALAQVDWGVFPGDIAPGQSMTLQAFHMVMSRSRMDAVVWMFRQVQLSWLPSTTGFSNAWSASLPWSWSTIIRPPLCAVPAPGPTHETYRRYAPTERFHIEPCQHYSLEHKGKVGRVVRSQRGAADPTARPWDSVDELQTAIDTAISELGTRRRCPPTGTLVADA